MSKKPKKNASNSKATALPRTLRKIKTKWDLKTLYYKNENDPQIEKDIQKAERVYIKFAKRYRDLSFTKNDTVLLTALRDFEKLAGMPEVGKPGRYFSLRYVLNAKDDVAEKRSQLISNRLKKASNHILFFEIELGKLSQKKQKMLLADPQFTDFHYYLERVFLEAKHTLTEDEEKILRLKSDTSYGMWVAATDKIISNRTVKWKGEELAFNEALESLDQLTSKEKPKLWRTLMDEMQNIGEIAENEFTAVLNDAQIDDELRGYTKPYSATALAYEDTEKSIEALVDAVSTKGFALSRSFYKAKAKYHSKDSIHYAQKYDSIGATKHIPFNQAMEICRGVFYDVHSAYGEIFDAMLTNGQIDVYPQNGKRGGAFMSGAINLPTHVFLNHTDTFKSLETLAHEMGHAIHTERSKSQPVFYQDHSITTAETASTLFENLVFDAVYREATDHDKKVLLHDRITRDIATIQRQIACFNAELEMHQFVREQGAISSIELRDIMTKYLRAYLGKGVEVNNNDGYSYVYWSHLRYGFYVYTYAFGLLMSTIMADHYKEDPGYIQEIDRFLKAGKSDTVANIFASIGIDVTKPETFTRALKNQEADIAAFKKLTTKTSK